MGRRPLAGPKAHHKQQSLRWMSYVRDRFREARRALAKGSCTQAYMNIVEGWEAIGKSEAHGREAGATAYKPVTDIQNIAYDFTTKCLRDARIAQRKPTQEAPEALSYLRSSAFA